MIIQITTNDDNVITAISQGGYIENGITVSEIPTEVWNNCEAYRYINGEFIVREDFDTNVAAIPPKTELEIQDEINLDIDYRLTCLELGI